MAPIRRYLRITKYSVLEVRIYVDPPSLAETWLLRQPEPALPRIIDAVRPLVLPKLREENERAKGKGKGKKGVRDVVSQDDFEVSIFLTEHSSRHSLLTKQKQFEERSRIKGNTGKLTAWLTTGTREKPVDLEENDGVGVTIRQEDEDEAIDLDDIPEIPVGKQTQGSKRLRRDSDDDLFVQNSSGSDSEDNTSTNPRKRRSKPVRDGDDDDDDDDGEAADEKKKLGLKIIYDGFSIYGRILCLVVKRKGGARNSLSAAARNSQQMMESWVSTQAARELGGDEEDEA